MCKYVPAHDLRCLVGFVVRRLAVSCIILRYVAAKMTQNAVRRRAAHGAARRRTAPQ